MKKAISCILLFALCLSLAGCGSLLDGEYRVTEHYADELPVRDGGAVIVRSYQGLRNALLALVDTHQEEETLSFSGYGGDVAADLPRVCSELKAENALCAYAVDYISYELSRIVSYYEAKISVNYSRSAEELEALHNIGSVVNAEDELRRAIEAGEETLVFSAVGSALTAQAVQDTADACYYSAPLTLLRAPETTLSVYPNSGISHIYEVQIRYGDTPETSKAQLAALRNAAETLVAPLSGDDSARAVEAAQQLASGCTCTDASFGEPLTAYGALVSGSAAPEGFAMAYKALCDLMGIDCLVISGRLEKSPHVWNMVRLGDGYYHVDVSALSADADAAVLRTDSELRDSYWWDIDLYPASAEPVIAVLPDADASDADTAETEASDAETAEGETRTSDLKSVQG